VWWGQVTRLRLFPIFLSLFKTTNKQNKKVEVFTVHRESHRGVSWVYIRCVCVSVILFFTHSTWGEIDGFGDLTEGVGGVPLTPSEEFGTHGVRKYICVDRWEKKT
jgi:hypothetical protein